MQQNVPETCGPTEQWKRESGHEYSSPTACTVPVSKVNTQQHFHRPTEPRANDTAGQTATRLDQTQRIDDSCKPTSFAKVRDELLEAPWYWGDVSPMEAADILESMPDDTFLVRDSTDSRSLFALTYRTTGGAIGSSRINFRKGRFSLNYTNNALFESFDSLLALIENCIEKSRTQPVCMVRIAGRTFPVRLRLALARQGPQTLQEACRRRIRQHWTRTQLEDRSNGLPFRMRQYILACQFRPDAGCRIVARMPVAETAV